MAGPQRTSLPASQFGPAVLDTIDPHGRDALLESYEQGAREDIAAGGDLADRLQGAPAVVRAAYQRRLELLDALPLGDLTGKVCVHFGVGSRGFAASFPKLQDCGTAIGVDFSLAAVTASAEISARGQAPYGRNVRYLTSRGDRINLPDASADVIYADESIERVENADAFLEEAHRILKPGGLLVLTTIQADPEASCVPAVIPTFRAPAVRPGLIKRLSRITPRKVFARVGQLVRANPSLRRIARFVKRRLVGAPPAPVVAPLAGLAAEGPAVNPEHLGGLTYADLLGFLSARFNLVQAHGYGGPVADPGARRLNAAAAQAQATQLADQPERARGIVLLARKRADYQPGGHYRQRRYTHESHDLRLRGGPWEVTGLHRALSGRLATGGEASWLTLPVEGSALVLHFWTNPWGGEAVIEVAGVRRAVNLYSPGGCFKRVHVGGLGPGRHELRVAGSNNRDPRSLGNQVIFYQAIAYGHEGSPKQNDKPGRVPPRSEAERARLRQRVAARPWFHTIDLGDGIVTPGCDNSSAKVAYLGLPERLDGLSVLDIGAYDGFFSFECERRGAARVVAADHFCWTYGGMATKEGFDLCKAALGSRVAEAFIPVEDISPERVGVFDVVLFLGVLYHAPDMVRYLRMVRSVCRGRVILETEVDAEDYPRPAAVFYPGNSLNNDASNFWGPNTACVEAMLREVGFRKVERVCTFNMVRRGNRPFHRAVFHAFV
jgi:tRNA (mo5U34)-methyltransferase